MMWKKTHYKAEIKALLKYALWDVNQPNKKENFLIENSHLLLRVWEDGDHRWLSGWVGVTPWISFTARPEMISLF